jgi:hypothetical protein
MPTADLARQATPKEGGDLMAKTLIRRSTMLTAEAVLPTPLSAGHLQLLQAFDCAVQSASDVWDFASEIADLRAAGMTSADLRWLVTMGFAQHGEEISAYGAPHRVFRAAGGFAFVATTSFVLTPEGARTRKQRPSRPTILRAVRV